MINLSILFLSLVIVLCIIAGVVIGHLISNASVDRTTANLYNRLRDEFIWDVQRHNESDLIHLQKYEETFSSVLEHEKKILGTLETLLDQNRDFQKLQQEYKAWFDSRKDLQRQLEDIHHIAVRLTMEQADQEGRLDTLLRSLLPGDSTTDAPPPESKKKQKPKGK